MPPATSTEYTAGRRLQARFRTSMEQALNEIVAGLIDEFGTWPSDQAIVDAVNSYPWEDAYEKPVITAYGEAAPDVMQAAGDRQWRQLGINGSFTLENPYSQLWLEHRSSWLVKDITDETRLALRETLAQSFRDGLDFRRRTALVMDTVGLDRRSARALANYERGLAESNVRNPEGKLKRRAKQLHKARAKRIARTEATNAHGQGILDSWYAADDGGYLARGAQKKWIAGLGSDRTCPICISLHGQIVPLRGSFYSSVSGRFYTRPAAHPSCMCTHGLVFNQPTPSPS